MNLATWSILLDLLSLCVGLRLASHGITWWERFDRCDSGIHLVVLYTEPPNRFSWIIPLSNALHLYPWERGRGIGVFPQMQDCFLQRMKHFFASVVKL